MEIAILWTSLLLLSVASPVGSYPVQDARCLSVVGFVEPSASLGLVIEDIDQLSPFEDRGRLVSEGLQIGTWSVSCNCERILLRCVHDDLRPVDPEGATIPFEVCLTTDSCRIEKVAKECFLLCSFAEAGVHVADSPVAVRIPETWYRDVEPDSLKTGRYRLDIVLIVETY